jgi:hypothetical protein
MKILSQSILPALAVFLSGACLMSLEMLGSRLITPVVGATINVWTALITVFLAGIAIGYYLGDVIADTSLSLKTLGGLFLAAALFVSQISPLNAFMNGYFSETTLPYWVVSLLYTALLLFIPAMILGGITVYTIRLSLQKNQHIGLVNGILYAISTMGSLVGIIGTSFFLIPFFSVSAILFLFAEVLFFFSIAIMVTWLVCL